mmetsp:Transcript_26065/g.69528  ORF Transcript_26065/g.69528 Transcript_26065/m.69528 type:complete len:184 (-) Transcript_26065:406-957(-)
MPPKMVFFGDTSPTKAALTPAPEPESYVEKRLGPLELAGAAADAAEDAAARDRLKSYLDTKPPPRVLDPADAEDERPSFRHEVHGIVPGYLGHKPRARDTVGTSVVGFTGAYDHSPHKRPYGQYQGNAPPKLRSVSHEAFRPKESKLVTGPEGKPVMPGYSGFVSKKRETYGASPYSGNGTYD